MERLSRELLKELMEGRKWPSISIFFDTQRVPVQAKVDAIKLDNLLRKAEEQLIESGARRVQVRDVLQPAWAFLDAMKGGFLQHLDRGLALFFSPGFFREFRLPYTVRQDLLIADGFYLKPLLPLFSGNSLFYLLALGRQGARLYHGTSYSISPVDASLLPDSLARSLGRNGIGESFPVQPPISPGAVGREPPLLSGERTPSDVAKSRIITYFQELRTGIDEFLDGQRVRLVLAGDGYLNALYREVSDYPHLMPQNVVGDQSELTEEELHRRAWTAVGPAFEEERRAAIARYTRFIDSDKTSRDIIEIAAAAYYKKVDLLFVPLGVRRPGTFDGTTGKVTVEEKPGPGVIDLIDFATAHTFLNGGTAYAAPPEGVPGGALAAALFRY